MAVGLLETLVATDTGLAYTGRELRPHFIRSRFGLAGDAAVAWRGPCDVRGGDLVDLEDRDQGLFIHSRDMLHVLVEIFEPDLPRMILLQRLLAALVADQVREALGEGEVGRVRREGDDVYVGDGKLSVSIATVSPVSALIHFGINVDTAETPVPTAGLGALGIDPYAFAERLLADLRQEVREAGDAATKVRPVQDGGVEG